MFRQSSNYQLQNRRAIRFKTAFSLIVGGLPLILYPGALIGGLISLSGVWNENESLLLIVVVKSCLIGSISYPLIYITSAVVSVVMARRQRIAIAFKISLIPLIYLLILSLLFVVWALLNRLGWGDYLNDRFTFTHPVGSIVESCKATDWREHANLSQYVGKK